MDTNTNNKSTDEGHGREKEDYEKIEKVAAEGANLTYSSEPSTSQHSQNPGEMKEITADGSRKENGHANAIEADNGELTGFTGYIVPSDDNDDDDDESMEITDYNHDVDIEEGDEIIETRPGEVFNPEKEQHMHCEESKNDKYTSDEESEEEDHQNELARDQYYDPEKDDDEESSDEELDEKTPTDVLEIDGDEEDSNDEPRDESEYEIVALSDDESDMEEEPIGEEQPVIYEVNEVSRANSEEESENLEKSGESEVEDDEYDPDEEPEEVDISDPEEVDKNEVAEEAQESQDAAMDDETANSHSEDIEEGEPDVDEPAAAAHGSASSVIINGGGVRTAVLRYDCGGNIIKTRRPTTLEPKLGFECRHQNCHHVVDTFSGIRKHEKKHRYWPCRECNEPWLDKENGLTHRWAHKKIYRCPFCEFESIQGHEFRVHVAQHQLETHKCWLCLMVFAFKSELEQHIDVHKWRQEKCELCNKRVDGYSKLKHMTMVHKLASNTATYSKLFGTYKRAIYHRKPDPKQK